MPGLGGLGPLAGVLSSLGYRDRPPLPPLNLVADFDGGAPFYRCYETSDSKYMAAGAIESDPRSGRRRPAPHRSAKSIGNQTVVFIPAQERRGVATVGLMAVQASREIVIDAPPDLVMEALSEVDVLASWSPLHKGIEILDRYPDGRPHHVKAIVKLFGIVDKEILEYHWGPNWVVWDAEETFQQRGQHGEYIVQPEGVDKARVRFDITVEPTGPIPGFVVKRASNVVLEAATEGLREWMANKKEVQTQSPHR